MNALGDLPSASALDRSALERLSRPARPGKPSILPRLVDLYLRSTPAQISAIGAAVAGRDHQALHLLCHTLKSSSASLGATRLAALLTRLEALARDRSSEGAEDLLAEIVRAHGAAVIELAPLAVPPELPGPTTGAR